MKYFYICPDVPGSLGENAVFDASVTPPLVSRMHYEFDAFSDDALITSFPGYVVTEEAKQKLLDAQVSGAAFGEVEVTTSEQFEEFREFHPGRELPSYAWLKPHGEAGFDDFGIAPNRRLVISERALDMLRQVGIPGADIEPYNGREKRKAKR
jgi:hypothetical protein